MLQPYSIATLPDLRARFPKTKGAGLDAGYESALNEAASEIERIVDRRLVMRAPIENDATDAMVASVAVPAAAGSTTLTVLAQPGSGGRLPVVTVTDPGRVLLAGDITVTLTITGTVAGVPGVTQAFDLCQGVRTLHAVKFFTAVSGAVLVVTGTPTGGASIAIGYSAGYLDYLTPMYDRSELWLPDWPARQVAAVYEDTTRQYGASTLLVEGTDYFLSGDTSGRPRGVLVRIYGSSAGRRSWSVGLESVKVVWSCGAYTPAGVHPDLKAIAARTAYSNLSAEQRGNFGASSMSDAAGNFTRFAAPGLSPSDREKLDSFKNFDFERAYRRAFDLEAA